jgi:hypothetical protein
MESIRQQLETWAAEAAALRECIDLSASTDAGSESDTEGCPCCPPIRSQKAVELETLLFHIRVWGKALAAWEAFEALGCQKDWGPMVEVWYHMSRAFPWASAQARREYNTFAYLDALETAAALGDRTIRAFLLQLMALNQRYDWFVPLVPQEFRLVPT